MAKTGQSPLASPNLGANSTVLSTASNSVIWFIPRRQPDAQHSHSYTIMVGSSITRNNDKARTVSVLRKAAGAIDHAVQSLPRPALRVLCLSSLGGRLLTDDVYLSHVARRPPGEGHRCNFTPRKGNQISSPLQPIPRSSEAHRLGMVREVRRWVRTVSEAHCSVRYRFRLATLPTAVKPRQ